MIVWGSKVREINRGAGSFFCPVCRCGRSYQHLAVSRYFTLYFVPLFETDRIAEFVRCAGCNGEFRPGRLRETPEEVLRAQWPWLCTACAVANPDSELVCAQCDELRAPSSGWRTGVTASAVAAR
jgi:hypothetical protein